MGRWIQTLIFVDIFFIIYCAEVQINCDNGKDGNQAYDLNALFTKQLQHLRNSLELKNRPLHLMFNPVFENLASLQFENLLLNSSKCLRDILYIAEHLKDISNPWALKMLDSYGKPESGILEANLNWPGDYTECTQIYAPSNSDATAGDFHGKYCSLKWSLTISNSTLAVTSGVCIPDPCFTSQIPGDVLKNLVPMGSPALSETNSFLQVISLECKPTDRHLNTPAKAVIVLLSLFSALVLIASVVTATKYFMNKAKESRRSSIVVSISSGEIEDDRGDMPRKKADNNLLLASGAPQGTLKKLQPFLDCFCAFKNGGKLLNTDAREGELLCIHGIRFLSMSWVILGHSYAFCFGQTRNLAQAVKLVDNFAFQIVLQGFYSVDSFFVLSIGAATISLILGSEMKDISYNTSGLLLTYLSMQEFSKTKGQISWLYFYIHRYIRLTPVYMIILGFSATVYLYLGNGPFWPTNDLDPICRDNWWWNLLYINNFSKMTEQCMGWSWYLANDMQFFIISPLFLITLWRWPRVGYSLLGIFTCACWLSNFFITYHFDMLAGVSTFLNAPAKDMMEGISRFTDYFEKLYIKPYTRIAPYLIGMLVGYILFARKKNNRPKHNWVTLCVGWIVATAVTLACIYGMYHHNPDVLGRSFFNAFSRTSFAVGLCWVIYVCLTDQGGFVNSILSYKLFIPLSRLTYTAYLIHPMIITGYYGSLKTTFEFSHPTLILLFLGIMVVTYGLALPVSLVFESPIMSLEKMVRNTIKKQQSNTSVN